MLFTSERRQNRISYEQSGFPVCYRPTVANQEISQIIEEAVPDFTKKAIKFINSYCYPHRANTFSRLSGYPFVSLDVY